MDTAPSRAWFISAATLGNMLEWYDFVVYGFFAVVISGLFFPTGNETSSLLLTFATFGAAFIARPIGAVVLGIYADRSGRKAALLFTIISMAFGTALVAFTPTYATMGIAASLLLVFARLIQGFSTGGELGGATALLVEHAPPRKRGFYASWQLSAQGAALFLASFATAVTTAAFERDVLQAWAWRLPFIFGVLIGPLGLIIRSRIKETPAFLTLQAASKVKASPVRDVLKNSKKLMVIGIGLTAVYSAASYAILLYMPTYVVRQLGFSLPTALYISAATGIAMVVSSPCFGALSDRFGRKTLMAFGSLGLVAFTYPAFSLITANANVWVLTLVELGLAVLVCCYAAPMLAVFSELFPTSVRSTAVATSYNVAAFVVGGFAPLTITWLISATNDPYAPAFYVMAAAVVSFLSLLLFRDRFRDAALQ